jgi:ATP-dependent DNA helicase RecG
VEDCGGEVTALEFPLEFVGKLEFPLENTGKLENLLENIGISIGNVVFLRKGYNLTTMNMITAEDIKRMAEQGESYYVDFKVAVPPKVRDITEEVCSFANAAGGYVLIGVDDHGDIKGASIDNSKRSAIQDSIGEVSPALHCELYSVTVDGKNVWVIEVPAGKQVPYFFGGNVFVREGANSQKLTNVEEIRALFQQAEKIYYDSIPTKRYNIYEDLDLDVMKLFRREAHISNNVDDKQLLENLQAFTEEGDVKRGAILFFARHPENLFFHAVVRCTQFKGVDKLHIIDDKTFGGPLVSQYEKAIAWLQDKLKVEYEISGIGARTEKWEVPLDVFREAIINAEAHRDYYEQGAFTCVEVYDDRIEISNPGGLLPLVAKNFGRKSLSRNPYIFSLFMRMNLVEHVGSGIGRMRELMLNAGLPEPQYETEGMFNIVLYRKQSPNLSVQGLSEVEQQVVRLMSGKVKIPLEELCVAINRKKSTTYKILRGLKAKGFLQD